MERLKERAPSYKSGEPERRSYFRHVAGAGAPLQFLACRGSSSLLDISTLLKHISILNIHTVNTTNELHVLTYTVVCIILVCTIVHSIRVISWHIFASVSEVSCKAQWTIQQVSLGSISCIPTHVCARWLLLKFTEHKPSFERSCVLPLKESIHCINVMNHE